MSRTTTYPLLLLGLAASSAAAASEAALVLEAAVSAEELAGERGQGVELQLSELSETAVLSGNSATGTTSGNNIIDRGAFSGNLGFTTSIQNTGSNVIIQDSTIVNVNMSQ